MAFSIRAVISADWGHELITPDGRSIRVPAFCLATLRDMSLIVPGSDPPRLKPLIHELLDPDNRALLHSPRAFLNPSGARSADRRARSIRLILGPDLSGPVWVQCDCGECRREESDMDNTREPWVEAERTEIIVEEVRGRRYRKIERFGLHRQAAGAHDAGKRIGRP